MLGVTWRGALAAGAGVATAAAIAACGASASSENGFGSNPSPGGDAGTGAGDDAGAFGDAAGEDGGPDSGVPGRIASALFVHASPSGTNLGPVRFCWETTHGGMFAGKPFPQQTMPASNFAGLSVGGAALLDDATTMMDGDLTLYAIDARQLAMLEQVYGAKTCPDLICPKGQSCALAPNKQYWMLATIPAGTLASAATSVLSLEGCLYSALDPNASTARCGADWNGGTGNLHAQVLSLADSPAQKGMIFVQAAQLSPGLGSLLGFGTAAMSLGTSSAPWGDAGIAMLGAEGQLAPSAPVQLALPALSDLGNVGIRIDPASPDAGAGVLFTSLAQAQQLVDPSADPAAFYNGGGTYLVAIVGDPNAPHAFSDGASGPYDGTGLHVLVVHAQPSP